MLFCSECVMNSLVSILRKCDQLPNGFLFQLFVAATKPDKCFKIIPIKALERFLAMLRCAISKTFYITHLKIELFLEIIQETCHKGNMLMIKQISYTYSQLHKATQESHFRDKKFMYLNPYLCCFKIKLSSKLLMSECSSYVLKAQHFGKISALQDPDFRFRF